MHSKTYTYMRLTLAMLVWGSVGLFVNLVTWPSMAVALTRFSLGVLVLLLFIFVSREKWEFPAIGKNVGWIIGGGISLGLGCALTYEAFRNITVSVATLIFYSGPVILILLSPLLLKERLTAIKLVGLAAASVGIFLINGTSPLVGTNPTRGLICVLLAVVLYVFTVVFNKKIKGISSHLQITFSEMLVAVFVLLPIVLLTQSEALRFPHGGELLCLLVIGVVHGGWLYYVYFSSLQLLPAQSVSLIGYLEPFSALVLSAIFLQERLTALQIIGAILLLCGTASGQLGDLLHRKETQSAKE